MQLSRKYFGTPYEQYEKFNDIFIAIDLEDDQLMKHVRHIYSKQYANNCSGSEPVSVLHFFWFTNSHSSYV